MIKWRRLPNRPYSIFAHFGAQTPGRISEMGTNLHQILGHDSPIICPKQVYVEVLKIALFRDGAMSNRF